MPAPTDTLTLSPTEDGYTVREFANKNFAKGAGTKAMNALSDAGADLVIEYGAEPLDPNEPTGKHIVEFVVSQPLEAFSPEDRAALADHKVTLDTTRGQQPVTTANTQAQAAGAEAILEEAPAGAPWEGQDTVPGPDDMPDDEGQAEAPVEGAVAPAGTPDVRAQVDASTNPTPAHPKLPEVQASQEVTRWDGVKETLPIPRGAGRKFLPVRNGVAYPASYTQTRDIWDTLDTLSRKAERITLLHEARAALEPLGFTVNAINTQYARWCEFWGYTAEMRAEVRKGIGPVTRQAGEETEAQRELKALKEREKALKAEAKAIEAQERKRLKKMEKDAERAAKRRSEEEAKELQRKHQSEEWVKGREERISSNRAVQDERLAAKLKAQRESLERQEKELEARKAESAAREAAARAELEARLAGRPNPVEQAPAPAEAPAAEPYVPGAAPQLQDAPGGATTVDPYPPTAEDPLGAGPALEANEVGGNG